MDTMTIEQLRTAHDAGGISDVLLKGTGSAFVVEIQTRAGKAAILSKARSREARHFGSPTAALNVLRGIGIMDGRFDAHEWKPEDKSVAPGHQGRSEAMRNAHRAAAYMGWIGGEIEAALDDPRSNLSNEGVLTKMDDALASFDREK